MTAQQADWTKLITVFLEKNAQINLSAIRDTDGVYKKHILDSLETMNAFEFLPGMQVADVGTGGGFPLLPLAIACPQVQFTGIDSTKKKVNAIDDMVATLGLTNVNTMRTRAEDCREHYDVVMARAVAYVDILLQRTAHLVKRGGYLIFMKQVGELEKYVLEDELPYYNLVLEKEYVYSLPEDEVQRIIYIIKKNK